MSWLRLLSAVATVRGLAPDPGNPAVDDIGGTAAAIIGIYKNCAGRAIFCAGAAFHTSIGVYDFRLLLANLENPVRTYQLAVAAADTFVCG